MTSTKPLKGDDIDAIKVALDKLNEASQEMGKVLYEQEAASQAVAPPPPMLAASPVTITWLTLKLLTRMGTRSDR